MKLLRDAIIELYRKAATSLPSDVEDALEKACERESKGSNAKSALTTILENIKIARKSKRPICQDTGIPVFFIKVPEGMDLIKLKKTIIEATRIATKKVPLRANAVDVLTERN
jgi:fumarate hydratase class I